MPNHTLAEALNVQRLAIRNAIDSSRESIKAEKAALKRLCTQHRAVVRMLSEVTPQGAAQAANA